jgi:2-methylisocitrate lyase-like PEP mutase family enzyme
VSTQPQTLKALIAAGDPFMAADCYSALTGRIVQQVGFPAAYMGGHATGMMHYAIPDYGVFTTTEMVDQAARVAEAISIPLMVDADQAGESVADVHRTIRRYERVGVAGVHIEDELTPKHSPFDGPLMSIVDMQARITAAVEARESADFVVIARCDELYSTGGGGSGSLDEAVRRGIAYGEAGADVFLPTFASEEDIPRIAAEVPIPIAGFGKLLKGLTFSLSTGWGTSTAARGHYQWAAHLREHGDLPPEAFEFPGKDELISQPEYDAVIASWATRTDRPIRPVES